MKNTVILLISIATFIACTKQKAEQVSTIDSTLQVSVDSILQNKLSELDATIGQAIVMEVRTGEIKAFVGSDSARIGISAYRFTFGSIGNKGSQTIRFDRCCRWCLSYW